MELTKTKYKQTEVGLIPEDWEVKTFKDIGEIKMCRRVFSYQTKKVGDIPFYKIGTFGKKPDAFITRELFQEYKRKFSFPTKGNILVSAAGTIGRTVVYEGEDAYFQDSNIVWIENNNEIVSNKYLQHFYNIVKYRTEGNTIQRLYNSIIYNTPIIFPPLPEQKAIAEVLSDVDRLIQVTEQKLAKKRAIKQGVMQKLLTPKEDWEEINLGRETELITKGTTPTSIGKEFTNTGINFIKVESLKTNGAFKKEMFAYIDIVTHKMLMRSQIKENDLLISIAGALGRNGIVNKELLPANTNQALAIVRLNENSKINLKYLFHYLRTKEIKNHIESTSSQGAQPNLSLKDIAGLPIQTPNSLQEQIRIATILSDMDKEIELIGQQIVKYKTLKQGLMQELLTGRIRLV